jgi:hypothetical protein
MKLDRRALFALPALAVLAAPFLIAPGAGIAEAAQGRPARGSLCAADEVVIYQCGIGRKLVAVCGSRAGTPHAQYRYGTPGHVELAYPGPGQNGLTYAREMYSGGGALQIRFTNGGHDYAVYSRTVRTGFGADGRNNPRFSDGIMIRRGGRLISNRSCTTAVSGSAQAEEFMPEGTILEFPD